MNDLFLSDSGGPLIHDGILVGIVSYGTRVCAFNMPDVFTRSSEFVGKNCDALSFLIITGTFLLFVPPQNGSNKTHQLKI